MERKEYMLAMILLENLRQSDLISADVTNCVMSQLKSIGAAEAASIC